MNEHPTNGQISAEPDREEIAIVGMSGRFPDAADLEQFWTNLRAGHQSMRELTSDELRAAGVSEAEAADDYYVPMASSLAEADGFDAGFFGYSKRESEIMDPQHRVFLEAAWTALEHAGYDPASYEGTIGVFGGVAPNTYRNEVLSTRPDLLEQSGRYPVLIGSEREYAVTRVAFKLDLRGPAISVSTACSTSGVALHLAAQSVLSGECDMALVGGARVKAPLGAGYIYEEDGIVSPDGRCRPFDAAARGTIQASGVGMLVIKRLSDAIPDGDKVHALIKGTAVANDGAGKTGFTAPGIDGQARVIAEAIEMAEVDPRTISYIEAHGTGTFIGDPIEMSALHRAFGELGMPERCTVGSVKSNIGHLDAGAGVAGVIKTVLAMQHGEIPPTANFTDINPQIDLSEGPFRVSGELTEWTSDGSPRRAGVSSFGLGGTNAHVVLEEAPSSASNPSARNHHLLTLSARSETALEAATARLRDHLTRATDDLADIAYTLRVGRRAFTHRRTVVASNAAEAAELLDARDARLVGTGQAGDAGSVAFMFPGGGAQHAGMGRELYETEDVFKRAFDRCAAIATRHHDLDLHGALYGHDALDDEELGRPAMALPTLFAVEFALAQLWISLGVRPSALIGHSLGEYTAACLAGVFSLTDALGLVVLRGRLFESLEEGGMLSVPLGEDDLVDLLDDDLSIAAINRADLCILAGSTSAIERTGALLEEREIETRSLRISVAAHSHLIEPILDEFRSYVETVELHEPTIPLVSNLTGDWIADGDVTDADYWARHLRETVRFVDGLETLARDNPGHYIEVGPGQTLGGYLLRHPCRTREHEVVASLPHSADSTASDAHFLSAVGRIWRTGGEVDLAALTVDEERQRVPLPTYPFERTRYWVERGDVSVSAPAAREPTAETPDDASNNGHVAPEPATADQSRHERILSELQGIFEDLSGIEREMLNPGSTFLELGFDSLFMTQASGAIGRAFGLRVSFRQLFEEAPTLDALAHHLDDRLPAEASVTGDADEPGGATTPDQPRDLEAAPEPGGAEPTATGPWRPVNRADEGLTATQAEHLSGLVDRLNARSPGSKQYTQAHRARLADPRSVAGFRRPWKELVYPVVGTRSAGSKIWDVDGNEYLDIAMGFGVTLFGHSPPFIVEAVTDQLGHGFEIGPQTPLAGEVAELIGQLTGNERVAFCNTGSEAVLAAMRLARTVSGRTKIVTFANDYHGLFDEVLARGVTVGGARRSIPIAPGIPPHSPSEMVVLDYDDPESLEYIDEIAADVAAVLVEPVQSRHPDLQPVEFLRDLRSLTEEHGLALIFDEMITGFRSHPGGIQELYDIRADLVTYGKVVGGGFPIGIVSGRHEYMDALDGGDWRYGDDSIPEADVTWFAGTFVRHPIALAASRASLRHLRDAGPALQGDLNDRTTQLVTRLNGALAERGAPMSIEHFSSFFLTKFHSAQEFSSLFYFYLRDRGIHVTEGRSAFLSTAHDDEDIEALADAYIGAVADMQAAGFLPVERSRARAIPESPGLVALSEGQQEIWLATQVSDEANCSYNLCNTVELNGPLDEPALESALRRLVERHSALRTTFLPDGRNQRVAPTLRFELERADLSDLAHDERQDALDELREREARTPFDLEIGPLLRPTLIKLGDDHHVLFATVHHIVCDGWSSGLIIEELGKLYGASRRGEDPDLGEVMQFREYARWQSALEGSEEWNAAEAYWQRMYGDTTHPVSDIPPDGPRPPTKTYTAERQTALVDHEHVEKLRAIASAEGQTLFNLILAAFECYLHRLSGQTEISLGVSIAGHTQFPGTALVGHCVNMLPLRRVVDADAPFTEHLATTREAMFDAFEHQNYSYGSIVRNMTTGRDPSRTPLVSVVFNMDASMATLDFGELDAVAGSSGRVCENFDVFVNLVGSRDGLVVEWTYNTDLFSRESANLRLAGFVELLHTLVENHRHPVSRIPLLTGSERSMLELWNETHVEFDDVSSLIARFERRAATDPDAPALVFRGESLSYGELNARANRLAHWLIDAGVGPGVLVGIMIERSFELVVSIYGILKAGGAYVPLDPDLPADRLAFMTDEAQLSVVLTQDALRDNVPASTDFVLEVDAEWGTVARCPGDDPGVDIDAESIAYVIYTSGSTGRPKGVANAHRGIVNHMLWLESYLKLEPSDGVLLKTPFSFDVSLCELFLPLQVGARLVIAEPGGHRDPLYLVSVIDEHALTTVHFVPSMLRLFLDDPHSTECSSLQTVICTGEAVTFDLQRRFFEAFDNVELHNLYGPTEAAVHATYWRCDPTDTSGIVPIGAPLANTQIHILDDQLQPVPIGVAGELHIGGTQVAEGYLNRPELTAERFIDNSHGPGRLYKSGDLARWRTDGAIEYLGRTDHQVKIRGNRVELGEIEATLLQHPHITTTAVVVHTLSSGDEQLVAYVNSVWGTDVDEAELRDHLKQKLPSYMIPNLFIAHDDFQLTTSGKIDRAALPPPVAQSHATATGYAAPRTELERQLVSIWEKTLERQRVGVHDDFFELGGHSLLAAGLMREIEDHIVGEPLPLATLFRAPTIAEFTSLIAEDDWSSSWASLVPIQPNGGRTPVYFVHAHGGNVIGYRDLARRLGPDQPFYGLQSPETGTDGTPRQIPEMAAAYIDEIRTVQPHGPYVVGGWCLGGDIAFEMAQQLRASGEQVALVVMIDNVRPDSAWTESSERPLTRLAQRTRTRTGLELHNLREVPRGKRLGYLAERARHVADAGSVKIESRLEGTAMAPPSSAAFRAHKLAQHHEKAYRDYRPEPYAGRVAVIRAERQPIGRPDDPTLGWGRFFAGESELLEAPGYRIGLLDEPRVEVVAAMIREAIDRALEAL